MRQHVLTFDVDWAPDWAVEMCVEMCLSANVPLTLFVTHASDFLSQLRSLPQVELGIHPNFLSGSSHGADASAVMDAVLRVVPTARSMRTHSLVQSSPLLEQIARTTLITNDVSLFLPFVPDLRLSTLNFADSALTRLPYSWEDDEAMCRDEWDWRTTSWPGSSSGYCVWDFHPIHVALNSDGLKSYQSLKASLGERPLYDISVREAEKYRNHGLGAASYLADLLRDPEAEWQTVQEACIRGSVL